MNNNEKTVAELRNQLQPLWTLVDFVDNGRDIKDFNKLLTIKQEIIDNCRESQSKIENLLKELCQNKNLDQDS